MAANGASFGYDANGNLTSKTDAGGSWTYSWDYENRLQQARKLNGVTINYAYDALGRRIQRTSSGGDTTKFVYDGVDALRDLDSNGNTIADYLNGPGIDNKLRQIAGGVVSYFVTDHLLTTRAFTDASGNLTATLDYDSFGNPNIGSSPTRYTYTGREIDADDGHMYYRFRWYSPHDGRFASEDLIGLKSGINLYSYALNSPANAGDPLGLYVGADDAALALGGAVVGLAGQAFGDIVAGKRSGWEDYVGSALGGAVGGVALEYTGPLGAGAVGGFATNLSKQILKNISGKQCGYDINGLLLDTGLGALFGRIIPGTRILGMTAGRNSYSAVYKQMVTKMENGTISRVSANTAGKMFAGRAVSTGFIPGAGAAAATAVEASRLGLTSPSETGCPCRGWK